MPQTEQRPHVDDNLPPGSEVLIVEDDAPFRKRLSAHLRQSGVSVTEAGRLAEARRLLKDLRFDYALFDLHLPDGEAITLLKEGAVSENTGVVVMTAFGGIRQAVEAMRLGAGDYLSKPFEPDEIPLALLRCRRSRLDERRAEHRWDEGGVSMELHFGESLRRLRSDLDTILAADRRMSGRPPPILIEGETGTGKSVLARWIHRNGPRAAGPFVNINCAALPDTLAEAELFGHERGAFTDAKGARVGLFEAADGGTLFLDEIGSLSMAVQAKLLTAVEDGRIRRLGGSREFPVDARMIVASNRPLESLVQKEAFRDDLLQRLKLLCVTLPPLRERGTDVVPLARHLAGLLAPRHGLKPPRITPQGEARLLAQPWRGNIRELSHEIERALIFGGDAPMDFSSLGGPATKASSDWRNPAWRLPPSGFSLEATVDELIADAMRETDNNVSAAARRLGVTRDFVRYRLPRPKAAAGARNAHV